MCIHFDHKVFGELFGNERHTFYVFEVRVVVCLHTLEIQRSQLLKTVFNNERTLLGAAATQAGKLAGVTRGADTRLALTLQHVADAGHFLKHLVYLTQLFEQVRRDGGSQLLNLGVGHVGCQQTTSAVERKVLLIQDAREANQRRGRRDLFAQQVKDFGKTFCPQLLEVNQTRHF